MTFLLNSSTSRLLIVTVLTFQLFACSSKEQKISNFLDSAQKHLDAENFEKAKIEYRNALQIDEESVPALHGLVTIYEHEQDWSAVYQLSNRILEKDNHNINAALKLASLYYATDNKKKYEEVMQKLDAFATRDADVLAFKAFVALSKNNPLDAVLLANQALTIDSGNIQAISVLAKERMMEHDSAQALEILNKGLITNSKALELVKQKIDILESTHQLPAAEKVIQDLIQRYPQKIVFKNSLVNFYARHQQMDKAVAYLNKTIQTAPDDSSLKILLVKMMRDKEGVEPAHAQLKTFIAADPQNMALRFAELSFYQGISEKEQARALLKLIIKQAKDLTDQQKAKGILASLFLSEGNETEALATVKDILEKEDRNEQALLLQSEIDIRQKSYEHAIANLRIVLRDSPFNLNAYSMLAQAHELMGATSLAEEYYIAAMNLSQREQVFVFMLTDFFIRTQQYARAEDLMQTLLKNNPQHQMALITVAEIKLLQKDTEGAQDILLKLKTLPDTEDAANKLNGKILASQNKIAESVEMFKKVLAKEPHNSDALISIVKIYSDVGKDTEALTFLDHHLQHDPSNQGALILKAQLLEKNRHDVEATDIYKMLIQKNPNLTLGYEQIARIEIKNGRLQQAQAILDQGIQRNKGELSLQFLLANIYELNKQFDAAIQLYTTLLERTPEDQVVINNLVSLLCDHRKDKASLNKAYQLSLKLNNSNVAYVKDTIGWAAYKVGKNYDAMKALEDAIAIAPDQALFAYHLGIVHLASLNKPEATEAFNLALKLVKPEDSLTKTEIQEVMNQLK